MSLRNELELIPIALAASGIVSFGSFIKHISSVDVIVCTIVAKCPKSRHFQLLDVPYWAFGKNRELKTNDMGAATARQGCLT